MCTATMGQFITVPHSPTADGCPWARGDVKSKASVERVVTANAHAEDTRRIVVVFIVGIGCSLSKEQRAAKSSITAITILLTFLEIRACAAFHSYRLSDLGISIAS